MDGKLIRTPKGKLLTPRRYLALVAMMNARERGMACEYDHFSCAAWHRGPCANRIAADNGLIEEDV